MARRKMALHMLTVLGLLLSTLGPLMVVPASVRADDPRSVTIMPLGDPITEGDAGTYVHDGTTTTQHSFLDGVLSGVVFSDTIDALVLNDASGGTFTSQVFDAGDVTTWESMSWVSNVGELPDGGLSDATADVSGNVLLFHLNKDAAYGEDDSVVHDFSGSGHDGTASGSGVSVGTAGSGKFAGGYVADGTNDAGHIEVASHADFDFATAGSEGFSFFTWFNKSGPCDSPDNTNEVMASRFGTGHGVNTWWFGCRSGDNTLGLNFYPQDDADDASLSSSAAINDGNWHLGGWIYDPVEQEVRLYLDGEVVQSGPSTPGAFTSSNPLCIGAYDDNCDTYEYVGALDEVAVFKRALSDDEVRDMYERGRVSLDLSVRGCDDAACAGESFTDQADTSPQDLGIVSRYLQYEFNFGTDGDAYTPQLHRVDITHTVGAPEMGSITIEKVTNPAGGTGFDFAGDLGVFTLDDGGSQPFVDQAVGDYDVTETAPLGWMLTDVTCTGGDYDLIEGGVTIHLDPDETITCTFTNEETACPAEMISYWKLDETGTPTTFEDSYGDNDGSCTSGDCPDPVTGLVDGAMSFDGDDEVNVPDDVSLHWSDTDSLSVEAWISTTQDCTGNKVFIGKHRNTGEAYWWLGCTGTSGTVEFEFEDSQGGGDHYSSGTSVNDGTWHHIVGVIARPDTVSIYVDGELKLSTTTSTLTGDFTSSRALNIGHYIGSYNFDGLMDEVAVYERALSAAEVQEHYVNGLVGRGYCELAAVGPTITSTPITYATVGIPYSYDVEASGSPVPTYTLSSNPAGMTIDESTGEIAWTPSAVGDAGVTLEAHNAAGTDIQSFTITVNAVTPCPLDMVGYWRLDEETSGSYEDDYGSHDGACAGSCPAPTGGVIGDAQQFSRATGTGIDIPGDIFDWGDGESFSVEFWMAEPGDVSGNAVIVGRQGPTHPNPHIWIGVTGGGVANFSLYASDGDDDSIQGTTDLTTGRWHHIVAIYDASGPGTLRLYVDGEEEAATTHDYASGFATTTPLNVGWLDLSGGFHYDGKLDELAIYSRALTEEEIKSHYYLARGYCETCATPVRVMPLGDSITYDNHSGDTRPEGERISYRMELWYALEAGGYNVDFVGSQSAGYDIVPPFDPDNEGWPGWRDDEIASHIYGWLETNPADVILLHIGTNALDSSATDVEDILNEIDRYEADYDAVITVLLARIINRLSYSATTTQFNDNVEAMATARIESGDRIIIVDMEDGAGLIYAQDTTEPYDDGDMYDNLHPNDDGYAKMASTWFNGDSFGSDGLADFLPVCGPPTPVAPTITSVPVTEAHEGWPYTYDVEASGTPVPTYTLTVDPTGMTIDEVTGEIAWTPSSTGTFDVEVEAVNSAGSDTQAFQVAVSEAPACPLEMTSYHKLDEGAAPYSDYLGGPEATCTACPAATVGRVNGSQQFDGADDEVNVADNDQYDWAADTSFTIEYWMNKSTACTGNEVIVGRDDAGTSLHWWTGCQDDGTVRFQLRDVNGNGLYLGGSGDPINDGEWHHLVFVRDESINENRIYVDGVETHHDTHDYTAGFGSSVPLNVGYLNLSGHYRYDGLLDEVALYERALTQTEIEQHYNAGLAGQGYCEIGAMAPTITSDPVTHAWEGVAYSYDVEATGSPVPTYTLTLAPEAMTIDEVTGLIQWTPAAAGISTVTVEAVNTEGSDVQEFAIEVFEPGACPPDILSYWRLDESEGTVFDDFVGANDAGCTSGHCPSFASGLIGGALDFNGTSDYLTVPDDTSLDWASDTSFSIELWANFTNVSNRNKVMIGRDEDGGYPHWWLGANENTGYANFNLLDENSNGVAVTGDAPINDGQWHHIVAVRDESTDENRLYVDGQPVDAATHDYTAGFAADTGVGIGYMAYNHVDDYFYDGLLDEVAIYSRALTEGEIKTRYYLARGYCESCATPVRVMPLGDSITYDNYSGDPRPAGERTGYRSHLWWALEDAGYNVDFVGAVEAGQDIVPPFDPDNAGYPGATDSGIAQMLDDGTSARSGYPGAPGPYLEYYPADVILLHIGTNSLDPDGEEDVAAILDEIDEYEANHNKSVTVLLARIINRASYSADTTTFNDNVEAMAQARIAAGDKIIIVDMEDGAGINYSTDMIDNLHPTDEGYAKMAHTWLYGDSFGSDGLVDFLPVCGPPTPVAPTITSVPVTEAYEGWPYTYDVEATGTPVPTYTLTVAPTGMAIDEVTGEISWLAGSAGNYGVTVEAVNTEGADTQSFTIGVSEPPPCPTEMISYWKLDETVSGSYDDFYDGNDGACAGGCPTPSSGQVGGAQAFSRSSGTGIDVPADSSFDWGADDSFTIEYWMKGIPGVTCEGSQTSDNEVIVGRDDGSTDLHIWTGCEGGTGHAIFQLRDTTSYGGSIAGTTDLRDGGWHHVAVVRDNSNDTNYVYVDGVEEASTNAYDYTHGFGSATAALNLGWLNLSAGYYYSGALDEVAAYSRALSPTEIAQHYQAGLAGQGYCEVGPVASIQLSKEASGGMAYVGDLITYTYTIESPGGALLDPVTLVDDQLGTLIAAGDGVSLTAGEHIMVEANYLITADDLPGPIVNEATATGVPAEGDPVTDTATVSVNLIYPSLSVTKTVMPGMVYSGDTVTYTYVVENTGNVPLALLTLTDDQLGAIELPSMDVTGDAIALYTFGEGSGTTIHDVSGVGTPLDLVIEDASAVSWLPGGGLSIDSSTLIASSTPAAKIIDACQATDELSVEAWVRPANTTQAGPARIATLSESAFARNVTLGQIGDDYDARLRTTDTSANGLPSLTAGTVSTAQPSHVVYTRDSSGVARIYVNGVETGSRSDITGDFSGWDAGHRLGLANEFDADRTWLGELYLIAIYDRALGAAEVAENHENGELGAVLGVGQTITTKVVTTLIEDTVNTATVEATDPLGGWVEAEDTASVDVIHPTISMTKTAEPPVAYVGDEVTFRVVITNSGDVDLVDVAVEDGLEGCTLSGPDGDDGDDVLATDEVWEYQCALNVGMLDVENTATVEATDPVGGAATAEATASVAVINPDITIEKAAAPTTIYAGDAVTYTYQVSNPGDDPLSDVVVSDDKCAPVTLMGGDTNGDGLLDVSETWTYYCATSLSVDTTNIATVTGEDPVDGEVSDADSAWVDVINPDIALEKTADATTVYAGDAVTYTYVVTNPGDDLLSSVSVSDDKCAPVSGPSEISGDGDDLLDPGEVWAYTCAAALSEDTINVATATGTDSAEGTVSDADSAWVDVINPDIALEKTADATTVYAGDTVTYTYVVTNSGDDPLSSVSVSDDKCAPVSGPSEISGDGDDLLDPGEVWAYTCATTLSESTVNAATVTSVDSVGGAVEAEATASVTVISPSISLSKIASAEVVTAGEVVTYTYTVTNTGDDSLTGVVVSDDKCAAVSGPVEASGNGDGILDLDEAWVYVCSTTLEENTTNTGTATGTDSLGNPVTATDTASVLVIAPAPEEYITYLPLVARNQVLTPTQIAPGLHSAETCVRRGGLIRCP